MAALPKPSSKSQSSSIYDDDFDSAGVTVYEPPVIVTRDHPSNPFSSSQQLRVVSFNFTPKSTQTPLTACITQYDTQTHIQLTESGMFTTHMKFYMKPFIASSYHSTNDDDNFLNNNDSDLNNIDKSSIPLPKDVRKDVPLDYELLQGRDYFVLTMLCRKIAQLVITPQVPILFSTSLTTVLGLKNLTRSDKGDDDEGGLDLEDEQIAVMKEIVEQISKYVE